MNVMPEKELWQAVIDQAIKDYARRSNKKYRLVSQTWINFKQEYKRARSSAYRYLFESDEFEQDCRDIGVEPDRHRRIAIEKRYPDISTRDVVLSALLNGYEDNPARWQLSGEN